MIALTADFESGEGISLKTYMFCEFRKFCKLFSAANRKHTLKNVNFKSLFNL